MSDREVPLLAHLMRRAGFGATRDELDEYARDGYEATVARRGSDRHRSALEIGRASRDFEG